MQNTTMPLYDDEYTEEKLEVLIQGLSSERLTKYHDLSPTNKTKQLKLYSWNTALSESLYTPIQGLEIVTRNYFHQKLSEKYGLCWYDNTDIQLHYPQMQSILQAKESLNRERKTINPSSIIAILSFGFWTGLLGSKYETKLWRPCLCKSFANKSKPFLRKETHHEYDLIRILRNRIAHHEPIIRKDLPNHNERILKMIGWFCQETALWIKKQSRFEDIWRLPINPYS